jgi:hypothetical protein
MRNNRKRTSGAKALIDAARYGTAEAVPFVERRFSMRLQSMVE